MVKYLKFLIYISCLYTFAQNDVEKINKKTLLYGGTAHIGNGEVIENSLIIIENGIISTIERSGNLKVDISDADYYEIIGKHVYPGFIVPNTTVGLADIDAVRATVDFDEVGVMNPNVRSIVAYNTDSPIIPTLITNGILMGQVTPRGGVISGLSSVVEFDGWDYEEALFIEDEGLHINWPNNYFYKEKSQKNYYKNLKIIKEFFENAKVYYLKNSNEIDIKMEAMKKLFSGERTLFIHANRVKQIKESIIFCKNIEIKKIVLVGGKDAWRITDFLVENNIPVILNRIHRLPMRYDEDINIHFKTPKILHDAGILFCLDYEGDMERMGARNLPFTAGNCVAFGLSKEEALMSITLNTAKILGIDDKVGSLEKGKAATLFVSNGDALDMMGNNILFAFIEGKSLDLNNMQKELYLKYQNKYKID